MKKILVVVLAIVAILFGITNFVDGLSISSSDKVDISILVDMNKSSWEKLNENAIIDTPTTSKISLSNEKASVEKIIQIQNDSKILVIPDYEKETLTYIQEYDNRIEAYYGYGISDKAPWGAYWCIYTGKDKMLIYADYPTKKVMSNTIGDIKLKEVQETIRAGKLPSLDSMYRMSLT